MNGGCFRVSEELKEEITAKAVAVFALRCWHRPPYVFDCNIEGECERGNMFAAIIESGTGSRIDELKALLDQAIAEKNR